jgi:hypothetical protein
MRMTARRRRLTAAVLTAGLALAAFATSGAATGKPCYGALGATQTERRAAMADRQLGRYAGRDQRYAAGAEASLRARMQQRGCYKRDKTRDYECQRLAGQIATARGQTRAYARSGSRLGNAAGYHDDRAGRFAEDYARCGGSLRP